MRTVVYSVLGIGVESTQAIQLKKADNTPQHSTEERKKKERGNKKERDTFSGKRRWHFHTIAFAT